MTDLQRERFDSVVKILTPLLLAILTGLAAKVWHSIEVSIERQEISIREQRNLIHAHELSPGHTVTLERLNTLSGGQREIRNDLKEIKTQIKDVQ